MAALHYRAEGWHIIRVDVAGTKLPNGAQLTISTERKNPADTGAVTGSATYASFASSVLSTWEDLRKRLMKRWVSHGSFMVVFHGCVLRVFCGCSMGLSWLCSMVVFYECSMGVSWVFHGCVPWVCSVGVPWVCSVGVPWVFHGCVPWVCSMGVPWVFHGCFILCPFQVLMEKDPDFTSARQLNLEQDKDLMIGLNLFFLVNDGCSKVSFFEVSIRSTMSFVENFVVLFLPCHKCIVKS